MAVEAIFLLIDILALLFAVFSLIGNGCIIILIVTRSSLRKNDGLYLITALAVNDFAVAVLSLPYIIFLLSGWGETVDYSPLVTLILVVPIVIGLKMSSCLIVAISWDRLTAIHWPVQYRTKNRGLYAIGATSLGLIWALADVAALFSATSILPYPECAAAECFMNRIFRIYWGLSNMLINTFALIITALVLIKLRALKKIHPAGMPSALIKMITMVTSVLMVVKNDRSSSAVRNLHPQMAVAEREQDKFKYARRIAINVLFCAGFCIFLPSFSVFIDGLFNFYVFESVGPIIALGLLLTCVTNAFIYGLRHRDIRQALSRFRSKDSQLSEVPPSRAGSISGLQFMTTLRAPSRATSSDNGIISRTILITREASDVAQQIPNILVSDSEAEVEYRKILEATLQQSLSNQAQNKGRRGGRASDQLEAK